jgi:Rod binding domain-containing protein
MTAFSKPAVMDPTLVQQQARTAPAKAGAQAPKGDQQVSKTAQNFEAMFLAQLLQPMFKGIDAQTAFGGGPGADVYKEMMVKEYGKIVAQAGGVGIAEDVQAEMLRIQEQAQS